MNGRRAGRLGAMIRTIRSDHSLSDPGARSICKGKLGNPNEFGCVVPLGGGREHQARARRPHAITLSVAP
jgi:hypothetical protein